MSFAATPASVPAPVRWGILATGKIAEDFATALKPCQDVVLQAIGSRNIESANAFADIFDIPNRHGSFEALVADPTVDVIYVASPDAHHSAHALLAMRAGKAVLVEKPFCSSVAEAQSVVDFSRATGAFCMEALWTRFVPSIEKVLQLVRDGAIGQVRLINSDFGCPFPIPSGALNALGVYNLALTQMIFDAQAPADTPTPVIPSKLVAVGSLNVDGVADSQVGVLLQYSGTQLSTFTASLLVDSHKEALIVGSEGRIRILGPLWHSGDKIVVEINGQQPQEINFAGLEAPAFRPYNLLNSERLIYEALEVNRCFRLKLVESPGWSHAQSLQVMKMMEDIREQIRA